MFYYNNGNEACNGQYHNYEYEEEEFDSDCCDCGNPAKMECLLCLKMGIKPAPTFCSQECYKGHWKIHNQRQNHHYSSKHKYLIIYKILILINVIIMF